MILLKCHYSEVWQFIIVDIYHLLFLIVPLSSRQKSETLES